MLVRPAQKSDSDDLLEWRNDPHSQKMFFNSHKVDFEEHTSWLKKNLTSDRYITYIGELKGKNIGVCTFVLDDKNKSADVSINLSPEFRGRGLAKLLLFNSINRFLSNYNASIEARIKVQNKQSIKLFNSVGFELVDEQQDVLFFLFSGPRILFSKVEPTENQISTLYSLLKARKHNISHQIMPEFPVHQEFVHSQPYRAWFLVHNNSSPIGSVYLKDDNCIGLNLNEINTLFISVSLNFIFSKYSPNPTQSSFVPPYFYINVSPQNVDLIKVLKDMECELLQTSYRVEL